MRPDPIRISSVGFVPAPATEIRSGLLGWISCVLNGTVAVDGITLRRTAAGRLTLSFPARSDRRGGKHPIVRPIDDDARRSIEAAIFDALGVDAEGAGDGR